MYLTIGVILLLAWLGLWLGGVFGLHSLGDLVHAPLLVGLMLVLLGILKSRDQAPAA